MFVGCGGVGLCVPSLGRKKFLSTLSYLLPRQTSHIPYSLWLLGFPHLVAAPLDRAPQKEHRSFQVISSDAGNPCMGVKVLPFLSLCFFYPHVQIIRKLHTPMSNWAMPYWSLLSADTPYSPRVLIRSFHELHFMRPGKVKVLVTQLCPTLCPSQASILDWVAIPFPRGSSWPRDCKLNPGLQHWRRIIYHLHNQGEKCKHTMLL